MKFNHEFRDPIHAFVRMDTYERNLIDSAAFQRLRNIHQLALTYLVYPGASHRRFEHSLGVMELASRVYDTVTSSEKLEQARHLVPELTDESHVSYWRNVIRAAALCHDLGHLPFSHAAEDLLPDGEDHETLTRRIIESDEIQTILQKAVPPVTAEHVVELATETPGLPPWKQLLAEIIQSPFFGVDRIDYLLRDSWHAGVAYGRFDHFRLLDTIRILPSPPSDPSVEGEEADEGSTTPALGVERGGLESAEALVLARYYMFRQVYLHPIRRIYDVHLGDFLRAWLDGGKFPTEPEVLLALDDNAVLVAIREAALKKDAPGHDPAERILCRKHYKLLYTPSVADRNINLDAAGAVAKAAADKFGPEAIRRSTYRPKAVPLDFPVLVKDEVEAASSHLEVFTTIPAARFDAVYIRPDKSEEADRWLSAHKQQFIENLTGDDGDEET